VASHPRIVCSATVGTTVIVGPLPGGTTVTVAVPVMPSAVADMAKFPGVAPAVKVPTVSGVPDVLWRLPPVAVHVSAGQDKTFPFEPIHEARKTCVWSGSSAAALGEIWM
jgi:hypothetical protein